MIGDAKITDALLGRFLALAAPGRNLTSGAFLRGFPSPTVEAEAELEGLAERIRASEELRSLVTANPAARLPEVMRGTPAGQIWLAAFARYLDRYGHQVYNLDFVVPKQADDPLPVLLSLKAMAERSSHEPRARQRAIVTERNARVEETARSLDPLRRKLFRVLLGWARRFGPYREQALFYMGASWPTLRRLALELGQRLAERFGLSAWETQRRNEPTGALLCGFAVSPGQVTAPTSVIHSPSDFSRMEPGTILVCPTTMPAWTPLCSQARGLVTDVGGALAHGSIVAREYGIPAVLGTGQASRRIHHGQSVTVDGDRGEVFLEEPVQRKDPLIAKKPGPQSATS